MYSDCEIYQKKRRSTERGDRLIAVPMDKHRQPHITGRRVREVWISKKKWQALEKRVADLEEQVQGQLEVKIDADTIRKMLHSIERIKFC